MNLKSNHAITKYYNNAYNGNVDSFSCFIYATELLKLQKTRVAKVLASQMGTLTGISQTLGIEEFEARVILNGLVMLDRIRTFTGGGYNCYQVIDKTLPDWN